MRDTRKYTVCPSDLHIHRAFTQLRDHFISCKYEEDAVSCEQTKYVLEVDDARRLAAKEFDEFLRALDQYPHSLPIYIHSHWKRGKEEEFMCAVDVRHSGLEVAVESRDINTIAAIHEKTKELFMAFNPPQQKSAMLSKYNLKKSVFLAHRFDEEGKAVASTLSSLLGRLGFSVVEGEGYETRDIPDKVADRIRAQDIFICVVTPGDPSWILSEAAFAKGLNKYMIILVQEGVTFNKGIIGGDYEHLAFPKANVEKAFVALLGALPT